MNEHEIARLIYDVFQGLLYLNTMGIVHRDIKVANIFIDQNGTAKIADFGFAITGTQPFKDINIGSPIYMTPESLLLREYGPKTDVWAFGVFVYELLHGDTPLGHCSSEQELKERVLLPPKILPSLSEEVQHFIKLCLTVNPRYRSTIRDLTTTPYYQRLLHELECKSTNEMNTTMSSVQPDRALMLVEKINTYDEAMAILNYCRLIHKAT
jgi:serine/threonine protein kinase